jgi:hypothetical protein
LRGDDYVTTTKSKKKADSECLVKTEPLEVDTEPRKDQSLGHSEAIPKIEPPTPTTIPPQPSQPAFIFHASTASFVPSSMNTLSSGGIFVFRGNDARSSADQLAAEFENPQLPTAHEIPLLNWDSDESLFHELLKCW